MEGILNKINTCKPKYPRWLVTRKCCFCVPLRKGVAIFAYINLVLCLLSFPLITFMLVESMTSTEEHSPTFMVTSLLFLVVDLTNTVVLLIGIQKNNKRLLKVYFYVGIVFQVITLVVDHVYSDIHEYPENGPGADFPGTMTVIQNLAYYICMALNIYLLLLVCNTICYIEENAEVQYIVHEEPKTNNI